MLNFDDPRWESLSSGYRLLYDPRKALRALEQNIGVGEVWAELWNELHHQGDVDTASYAAVPHLVRIHALHDALDWNTYALVATIEEGRQNSRNPRVPSWLADGYKAALSQLAERGLRTLSDAKDSTLVSCIIALIAFQKGLPTLGQMAMLGEDERRDLLSGEVI